MKRNVNQRHESKRSGGYRPTWLCSPSCAVMPMDFAGIALQEGSPG